jgi:hypothetical protein
MQIAGWLWVLGVVTACVPLNGCAAARDVRDRISGNETPRPTRTPTATQTPTVPPPPTATPTPSLPPNPLDLNRWNSLPVHYCVDTSNGGFVGESEFASLVARAFASWGVPVVGDATCADGNVNGDKVNEIGFGTPINQPPPGSHVTEAGETSTTYSECTSGCTPGDRVKLVEADVVIESEPPRQFRTRDCLFSTLLHETGHFLGLEHLPAPAVMAAETSDCPTELTSADRAALLMRYGDRARPE